MCDSVKKLIPQKVQQAMENERSLLVTDTLKTRSMDTVVGGAYPRASPVSLMFILN